MSLLYSRSTTHKSVITKHNNRLATQNYENKNESKISPTTLLIFERKVQMNYHPLLFRSNEKFVLELTLNQ